MKPEFWLLACYALGILLIAFIYWKVCKPVDDELEAILRKYLPEEAGMNGRKR